MSGVRSLTGTSTITIFTTTPKADAKISASFLTHGGGGVRELVEFGKIPKSEAKRYDVIRQMYNESSGAPTGVRCLDWIRIWA